MTTTPGFVAVATASTDTVFGVTSKDITLDGQPVTLQDGDLVRLTAGGTIATNDYLVPTSNGAVVSSSTGAFVATAGSTSGGNLWARSFSPSIGVNSGPATYGSRRPNQFVRDLYNNVDSLDIIVIGDSNSGSALAGGYGYMSGLQQALSNMGASCYGTALFPFVDRSNSGASRFYGNWRGSMSTIAKSASYLSGFAASTVATTVADAVPYAAWNAGSVRCSYGSYTPYGTISGVTITGTAGQFSCTATNLQVNQYVKIEGTFGGTGSITGYVTGTFYVIIATNGSTTFTLSTTVGGSPLTTTAGTPTGLTYTSTADFDDWLYIPSSATTLYTGTGVNIREDHPLAANGVQQYLRTRYGKVATAGGRFIPNVYSVGAANAPTRLVDGGSGTTGAVSMTLSGGETAPTFNMNEVLFTANGKGHTANAVGYNTNGTEFSQGPGALFCQSIYRRSKGFAVHCHGYQAGEDSTSIARVTNDTATNNISLLLQEIRERQRTAGGTGRVLLFVHTGINGADTGSTWTAAHISIWNRYKTVWASLGYPMSDLAIVSMVGVQRNSTDTSGTGQGGADLVAVRAAANAMVQTNGDMSVIDIKSILPYSALVYGTGNASYYQRLNNSPNVGSDITVHLSGGSVSQTASETATVSTSTSLTLTGAPAVAADGYWNGSELYIDLVNGSTSAPAYQQALITQYNGTTKVATVNQWTGGQPTNGTNIAYRIGRVYPSNGYSEVGTRIFNALLS
jgi:hypothetical protein